MKALAPGFDAVLESEDPLLTEIKIADIRFGYNNGNIIKLLEKRGSIITANGQKKAAN